MTQISCILSDFGDLMCLCTVHVSIVKSNAYETNSSYLFTVLNIFVNRTDIVETCEKSWKYSSQLKFKS